MSDVANLQDRLIPSHLLPETEEGLKEEVNEAVVKIDEKEPVKDPRDEEEYTFQLKFTDGRGKLWQGRFVNRIVNIHDQQLIGVMQSRLGGGQPLNSLDALIAELNMMVAHLTRSLKDRPDWAKNLLAITNYEIVQAIYMEVASHEAHFHGRSAFEEKSSE